jgi:hypothetical protein
MCVGSYEREKKIVKMSFFRRIYTWDGGVTIFGDFPFSFELPGPGILGARHLAHCKK